MQTSPECSVKDVHGRRLSSEIAMDQPQTPDCIGAVPRWMDSKRGSSGRRFVRNSSPMDGRLRPSPPLSNNDRVCKRNVETSKSGECRGDTPRFNVTTASYRQWIRRPVTPLPWLRILNRTKVYLNLAASTWDQSPLTPSGSFSNKTHDP